jgi:hypothetical protein
MLPVLLRFRDLKRVNINNWPSLKRRVEKDGLPAGRYIGGSRVWTEEEVENWFNSRPKADDPPEKAEPATLAANEGTGGSETISSHRKRQPGYSELSESAQPRKKNGGAR